MLEKRDFYINGAWVAPAKANDFAVIDPSTEEQCAVISLGDQADTDAAVNAARAAFESWSQTSREERMALIEKLAEVYDARQEEMAQAMSMEMGAPIALSRAQQVGAGSWHIGGFLKAFKDFSFEKDFTSTEKTLLEPIGVCALITPWNWPMNQIILKAIPAVATGCTVVLKPSEVAPLSGHLFAEFMHEAGFPAGVFNMLNGDGPGVGSQLSSHPEVDMVSFTGSTRAGIAISKAAADTLKRVSLELGGKGANIIFEDADPKAAKQGAIRCFRNSGQSCNAPTRMLVHKSRYDEAVEAAADVANNTHVGPASEEGKHIGPVVSEVQFNKIQALIEKGMSEARLVAGGLGRPDGLNRGYYVKPTVFADVTNDMTIAQEEIFGPVLSIIPFDTEEEAVAIANDTPYGLTNYVQTTDDEKRRRVARRLRSGMVETNGVGFAQGSPFGGYKQSGNGREGGAFGLEEFLEVKAVSGWAAE
ncbi:Aldehyde dehydrogenase [Sulfitobacter noctilucicola]|uniref:aldehyde dehydrogenase (NAD(+)) n=1 Tax=Sulfitobacter noctilucicola TaxID=1342301 RepID=A0A7W6M4N3_9RHOB|nr:aldehyde dehydrogenase family protein [Sulfitobacter noctilucicola]KIN63158.1 Aldehyde dehydrogenase [Sulfitobacter noctilucicola]MBB4172316.1 aldehyde dehydrogenase (NAD+) [Sulfitobacter noctilucicola]